MLHYSWSPTLQVGPQCLKPIQVFTFESCGHYTMLTVSPQPTATKYINYARACLPIHYAIVGWVGGG